MFKLFVVCFVYIYVLSILLMCRIHIIPNSELKKKGKTRIKLASITENNSNIVVVVNNKDDSFSLLDLLSIFMMFSIL